ncbi:CRISPR-associated helicase/endonuclease Cas3, partial [Nitrolancea hollandica]|uniref:CRISPR-associated helicase/endonuclease Cas3 n=1 Tax=Nitrolancea hollandica TaxID=1206749 RepID=UPI00058AF9A6
MQAQDLLALWAKTPRDGGISQQYHPLICHMIDVAMVAQAMWHDVLTPALQRRLIQGMGIGAGDAGFWIPFLAGLHDIGKASPGFQAKDSRSRSRLDAAGFQVRQDAADPGHGLIGTLVIREILEADFAAPRPFAAALATALGGHHGKFPLPGTVRDRCDNNRIRGGRRWDNARQALAQDLARVLGFNNQSVPQKIDHAAVMILAGLVSVADWIGSDERFFSYAASNDQPIPELASLTAYAEHAKTQARKALKELGWLGWKPSPKALPFTSLFPGLPGSPRPVQMRIAELPGLGQSPGIVIVELPMGEGKTEAALYLADRWSVNLGQRGLYIAMPTMATANQMFSRVHEYLGRRYPDSQITLQLLHSHAALASDLEALEPSEPAVAPSNIGSDFDQDGSDPTIVAGEWFTRRKRGLLAPFGVGTVDQSFLAALQTRHVFVRLFGLAGKTVIFDEVHAYDVYMSTIFKRLLEWLGALGSSVIVLSATLPDVRRQELINAYARGRGLPLVEALPAATYPRLTWFSKSVAGAESVAVSEQARRSLSIAWVNGQLPDNGDPFELGARLEAALAGGGCAAVICNTVNRAQQVYQALKPHFDRIASDGQPELDLFHARYLFQDRM